MHFDTKLLQVPECEGDDNHPTVIPLYQSLTFAASDIDSPPHYQYSRIANPTRDVLEKHIAQVESAAHAFTYASGVNAMAAVIDLLTVGDELIAGRDIYGGTYRTFSQVLPKRGIIFRQVDTTDIHAVSLAITAKTKMIWLETPSNPQMLISDIAKIAALAKSQGILVAVDNSLLVYLQNPLALGADITMISGSKHYSGHSDVTAGVVLTNDAELAKSLRTQQMLNGNALAPFEAWLLLRGMKTLSLRLTHQTQSAKKIAAFLVQHPKVVRVCYPRPGQAHYAVQQTQATDSGCVISFELSSADIAKRVVNAVKLFHISASFGCVHSFISLPRKMSHVSVLPENAPSDSLIRISIGLESVADLIADLDQAFKNC